MSFIAKGMNSMRSRPVAASWTMRIGVMSVSSPTVGPGPMLSSASERAGGKAGEETRWFCSVSTKEAGAGGSRTTSFVAKVRLWSVMLKSEGGIS